MTGRDRLFDQSIPRSKRPFWERPISRRTALTGTAIAAGGLATAVVLKALGIGSEKTNTNPVSTDTTSQPKSAVAPAAESKPTNNTDLYNEVIHGISIKGLNGEITTIKKIVSGKPTLLACFISYDPEKYISSVFSNLDTLRPQIEQQGVQVVVLNIGGKPEAVKEFLASTGIIKPTYPIFVASELTAKGERTNFYIGTGSRILLDENSKYIGRYGANEQEALMTAIANLPRGN